jgi:hypothetical protein
MIAYEKRWRQFRFWKKCKQTEKTKFASFNRNERLGDLPSSQVARIGITSDD